MDTPAVDGLAAEPAAAAGPKVPVFYFHLGSPECYLAAERLSELFDPPAQWMPVDVRYRTDFRRAELERAASQHGLQPVRWPARWPPQTDLAMRAATYARSIGRVTAFSLAAFRQVFAGGRDLDSADTVVIAAAACEIHPGALLKGIALRATELALYRANAQARAAGVRTVPAVALGELVFEGNGALEEAASALGGRR